MTTSDLLGLLLAVSLALNIAGVAGAVTHRITPGLAPACVSGGAAWIAVMSLYFAAVTAYA